MFFDATGTTDSATLAGANNTFQDVSYSWNFGDTGASGTGTWAHGSNSGHNSKNSATGAVAAHLYVTNGADTTYPVTVTAYDGTNTASCSLGVTAYDPSGANGFPGAATTCVAASSMPVAGSGGCPTGAGVLQQSNIGTVLSSKLASGKRVLLKCGDTFTGGGSIAAATTKATLGAYGGCENTATNRPVLSNPGGTTLQFNEQTPPTVPTDIRITDLDFEDGTGTGQATYPYVQSGYGLTVQLTFYNLKCAGAKWCWQTSNATESGVIQSTSDVSTGGAGWYSLFWNEAGVQCANGSTALYCGAASYNPANYYPVAYNAIIGNDIGGTNCVYGSSPGCSGAETVRISACRFCVISNNSIHNSSGNWGAVLKFHNGDKNGNVWEGQYNEYAEISDNVFSGISGANFIEMVPQDSARPEHSRLAIFERNVVTCGSGGCPGPGRALFISSANSTVRNNVFYVTPSDSTPPGYAVQVQRRGTEPVPNQVEVYNNTCYFRTTVGPCISYAGTNGWVSNNLSYNNGVTTAAVSNSGSGNTVSNNTSNTAANPLLINASGSFSLISDFQPTQNFAGGLEVPAWYDALGEPWSPTWSLGALKP